MEARQRSGYSAKRQESLHLPESKLGLRCQPYTQSKHRHIAKKYLHTAMDLGFASDAAFQDYMDAQQERANALAQLHELKRHLQAAGALSDRAVDLLQSSNEALARQQSSLNGLLAIIPLRDRRPAGAQALVEKVFSTAELLENILWFLGLHDALVAQQVNHAFFHAIEDSPRIQRSLGFLADEDSHLRVPLPLTTPSIYFFIDDLTEDFRLTSDNSVTLNGDIFNGVKRLPRLGSRSKRLLVSQPPVKKLSIYADCCFDRFATLPPRDRSPTFMIESKDGVTVGDVIDTANRIAEEHRTCPSAPIHMHDDKGFVNCSLYLSAKITLKDGDPRLKKKLQRREEEAARTDRHRGLSARIPPYIAAKQTARMAGQPIPTLEDFERLRDITNDPQARVEHRPESDNHTW